MLHPSLATVRRANKWWGMAIAALVMAVLLLFIGGRPTDVGRGGLSMLNAEDGTLSSRITLIEEKLSVLQRRCIGNDERGCRWLQKLAPLIIAYQWSMIAVFRFWLETLEPTFHYRSKFWLGKADNVEDRTQVAHIYFRGVVT